MICVRFPQVGGGGRRGEAFLLRTLIVCVGINRDTVMMV